MEPHYPSPHRPRWAQQTLESDGSPIRDPSDTQSTPSQHRDLPHAFIATSSDPQTFQEASGVLEWDQAMEEEYSSLMRNNTWELVPLPKRRKMVRCKWIY